jgi:CRISPR-associated exonuclease Cas4
LQHLAFCLREWALTHLEQAWEEDRLTAEDRLLHERVDLPDQVRATISLRAWLPVGQWRSSSRRPSNVVEFRSEPFPVEYKRGARKPTDSDLVNCVPWRFALS